ncbi:hypothetical protein FRC07_006136 [Ceratobasidium sp. 392]|nr:hypothetical protein FRC07_006136 [Ceratobasidium sp. 392]
MLFTLPVAIASGLVRLLALSADVTLSQVYTASAAVFYGHRLGRTAVESVMLLPMPSYVQGGNGVVPGDVALFAALSPITSPIGRPSPTLGDCASAVSSMLTSLVHASRTIIRTLAASISLVRSPPIPTAILTLDPYVGAPGSFSPGANESLRIVSGPPYTDFALVTRPVPLSACDRITPSKHGRRACNSCDSGRPAFNGLIRAGLEVDTPGTCTPSTLVSCGVGADQDDGMLVPSSRASLDDYAPVPAQLERYGGFQVDYFDRVDWIPTKPLVQWAYTPSALLSRRTDKVRLAAALGYVVDHILVASRRVRCAHDSEDTCMSPDAHDFAALVPRASPLPKDICVPSSLGSCGRGSESLHPPTRIIVPRLDNISVPSTLGSCGRGTRRMHDPRARPIAALWKVLTVPRMVAICYCLVLLALVELGPHTKRLYLDASSYLYPAHSGPTKTLGSRAFEHIDPAPIAVFAPAPAPAETPWQKRKWRYKPRLTPDGRAMKRPWIRKVD